MRWFLVSLGLCVCAPVYSQPPDISGNWLGALNLGATKLRLALHIQKDPAGGFTAKMDSPDQGAFGIPVGTVTVEDRKVAFEISAVRAKYQATMSEDGKQLIGEFMQNGGKLPLTLDRVAQLPTERRPQEPNKPYPYDSQEVSYENPAQKNKIAGTLTLPRDKKKVPAVILITGSGPQDRNEALFGHKPFLVLSDHLTRQGIAVLRVDDRGVGGSSGNSSDSTSLDFATDVLAGIDFLKKRAEIDSSRIGLIGHSEGGLIAPIVAAQSKDVAFIVMMAGTGVPGEEILYEQAAAVQRAMGASQDTIDQNRDVQRKIFAVMKTETDPQVIHTKVAAIAGPGEANKVTSKWFRAFLSLDPRPYLAKVTCPALVLNGSLDTQVIAKQNLPEIEKALQTAENKKYKIVELPQLNHLFQTARTGALSEYSQIDETIAPVALHTISAWILATTTKGN